MRHPNVPESLEGWWILHRMYSFDRIAWDRLDAGERKEIVAEAVKAFESLKHNDADCGLAQLLGHKADFMITHYARNYEEIGRAHV